MPKAKTLSPEELIEIILQLPFKDKVSVFDSVKASLLDEAKLMKLNGEFADKVLKNIELNSK